MLTRAKAVVLLMASAVNIFGLGTRNLIKKHLKSASLV